METSTKVIMDGYMIHYPPAAVVTAAREWIMDCVWGDLEPDDVVDLPDAAIMRGIERHYDGGLVQFIADGDPYAGLR